MEKSIVNYIAEAELQAAEIKSQGQHTAGSILFAAEEQAQKIATDSEAALTEYRERAMKEAEERARTEYEDALSQSRARAKEYAESLLENTQIPVAEIVGRIAK